MDPRLPLDYQIAALRSGYRTTTDLPINIQADILLRSRILPSYTIPLATPYTYPYLINPFLDYPTYPLICRHPYYRW